MTPKQTDRTDADKLNRRRLLQGIAATGAVTTAAGCLGDDDDPDDGDDDPGMDDTGDDDPGMDDTGDDDPGMVDDDDDEPVDRTGLVEGGRLEFAIERPNIDDYDQAESSLADDSMVFNVVYDGLTAANPAGEYFNWMAEEYEVTDAQDVSFPDDYTGYMAEYEIVDDSDENFPAFDIAWPNILLPGGYHPEDLGAYRQGELGAGDSMRILTREEAADAVEDGVYGVKAEGRLHEGIEFHNGDSCTAGDVVGSYDRLATSANEGQQFDSFIHAAAPNGADGLDFELYGPEPDAIAEVALPPFQIYPEAHHGIQPGDLEPRDGGEVPIGTGPYEIAEFDAGSQLLLQRTDNYWLENVGLENKEWWDGDDDFPEAPVIDEINIRFVPEGGTRTASLLAEEVDLSYQLGAGDRTAFDENPDYDVAAAISTGFKFMQIPMSEEGDLQHEGVRKAIANLIPRNTIVEIVAEGWGAPALAPIPEPAAGLGTNMSYEEFEQADFANPADPDIEAAEQHLNDSPVEPPVPLVIRTNADDEERQDKMQLAVDELNASGLFEASLETPAAIGDWVGELFAPGSNDDYGADNAVAVIGLASGFDPDGYNRAIHHPDNHNICCNFFHGEGSFDWIDDYDATRFGTEVAEDPQLRRDRFDDIWPQIADDVGNTLVDYSLETAVSGPALNGYSGYPDRRGFLSYGLYAPYDDVVAWIDRD